MSFGGRADEPAHEPEDGEAMEPVAQGPFVHPSILEPPLDAITRCPVCDRIARFRHCPGDHPDTVRACKWFWCDLDKVIWDPTSAPRLRTPLSTPHGARWLMRWMQVDYRVEGSAIT